MCSVSRNGPSLSAMEGSGGWGRGTKTGHTHLRHVGGRVVQWEGSPRVHLRGWDAAGCAPGDVTEPAPQGPCKLRLGKFPSCGPGAAVDGVAGRYDAFFIVKVSYRNLWSRDGAVVMNLSTSVGGAGLIPGWG